MKYRTIILGIAIVLSPLVLVHLKVSWPLYWLGYLVAAGALLCVLRSGRRTVARGTRAPEAR